MSALVNLFGANTPTAPSNPLGGLLWGLFRGLNTALGFTPRATTPTIGTPDQTTGTVTGTWGFSEPAGLAMTYGFTQAANGVVHVYTDGTFSYTPSQTARQNATATTTDSFIINATDSVASTNQTITVPVLPIGGVDKPAAGTPTVGTPDPATGTVTGTLGFTDPGGKTLTYSFATNPTQGTATVYTNGSYSYTPTQTARQNATPGTTDTFSVTATNGVASTTESVTVPVSALADKSATVTLPPGYVENAQGVDGTYAGVTTSGTGIATDPYKTTITVLHPNGATATDTATVTTNPTVQSDSVVVGTDGTVAYTSVTGSGTATDPYQTNLMVVHPNGTTTNETVASENPVGSVVIGTDGTTSQTTRTGSGTATDPYQTTVTVIHSNGTTTTQTLTGSPVGMAVGADGTVAQTTVLNSGSDSQTTFTVIHPDGTTTMTTPGAPAGSSLHNAVGDPVVAADGTAYQATLAALATGINQWQTTVTAIHPNGTITTTAIAGYPGYNGSYGVVVGGNGTAAQTTYTIGDGTPNNPDLTTVTVLNPNGSITTKTITGREDGNVAVGADGTVTQTTSVSGTTTDPRQVTLFVIHPNGTTTTQTTVGVRWDPQIYAPAVGLGPDGTVAQTTYTGGGTPADPNQTTITVVHPDGTTTTTTTITGTPYGHVPVVGADGTVAQTTYTGSGNINDPSQGAAQTTVTVIHPDGTITTTQPLAGYPDNDTVGGYPDAGTGSGTVIGSDGTTALTTVGLTSVNNLTPYTFTVIHPDGTLTTLTGTCSRWPATSVTVGADGTAAHTTDTVVTAANTQTTLTVVHPDGTNTTDTVAGSPDYGSLVAADGTTYQTTVTPFAQTPSDTITLSAVHPDGTTTTATIAGTVQLPVTPEFASVLHADGLAYQTIDAYQQTDTGQVHVVTFTRFT